MKATYGAILRMACISFLPWLAPSAAVAQTATALDARVQPPELAAPQRGSLIGQLSSVAFGPADVSRGAFSLPSPFSVPNERGSLLASVFPIYSPDAAVGEWGIGWQASLGITRTRLAGDLDYAADELTGPWGRMIQGSDGAWYPVGLSRLVRVLFSAGADAFTAYLPDGTQMTFGGAARVTNAKGTYAWQLVEVVSVTSRKTKLAWAANASGRQFVQSVSWGGVGDDVQYRADLTYAPLPVPFTDYRSGFALQLDQRVTKVTVLAKNAATGIFEERWHYDLTYQEEGFGPGFYLAGVQQVFRSGEMPPPTRYTYNFTADRLAAAALVPSNTAGYDPRNNVVSILRQFGNVSLQPDKSAISDVDQDGMPDVEIATDYTLAHQTDTGIAFEALPPAADASPLCRRTPNINNPPRILAQLRSGAGDETTYVVDLRTDAIRANTTVTACNRLGQLVGSATASGDWVPTATVRLVDLNRDHKPDVIRVQPGIYRVLLNTSTASTVGFTIAKVATLSPSVTPDTAWVQDMNGDGIPDIVVRWVSGVMVYYGKGNLEFSAGQSFLLKTASGAIFPRPSDYAFSFVDANKDGLTDLLLSKSGSSFLLMNRGTYFQEMPVPGIRAVDATKVGPYVADLSGSGDTQLVYRGNDPTTGAPLAWGVVLDGPETGLLATADDGRGTALAFTYARAAPSPGEKHRHPVLSRLTVTSSGYDAIAYDYTYAGPRLHTVGKFLVGFDRVVRTDPNVTESADLLNEDRYAGVLLATSSHDAKAPAADAFSSKVYEEALTANLPFKRLTQETKGFRDATGATVSETTDFLAYALDVCPSIIRTAMVPGTLTATKTHVRPVAFTNGLACLVTDVVEQGAHSDPTLDFAHEVAITRNEVGLVTKVESVAPVGRWTLQDVAYDAEFLVTSVGAPGRGTSTFQYEFGTRLLRQVFAPTGVATQVTSRAPATDLTLTLQTTRGLASWQQFFTYDGQERLATRRDDLGGATALNPNETYTYGYATATTPASIHLSTLIDAASASVRDSIELATGAGEPVGTVTTVPEGWAFGRLVSRSRARSEAQGLLRPGAGPTVDPTTMDWATLFAGAAAVDFTGSSLVGQVVEERTTFHAGVERRVATAQSIAGGLLVRTATENGTNSTTSRVDASRRVLTFDDEANVRYAYTYDALGRLRQVLLPDGRKHTASYDGHGRPSRIVREGIAIIDVAYETVSGLPSSKTFSSPAGQARRSVSWTYDSIGRVIREQHTDSVSGASKAYVSYYDGATPSNPTATTAPGLLTAVTGDRYTKLLEYRADGKLTKRTVSLADWRTVETSIGYVESGGLGTRKVRVLDSLASPIAIHDWRYGFDGSGRPASLSLNGTTLATFAYDSNDLLRSAVLANGDTVALSYDSLTRRPLGSGQTTSLASAASTQRMNTRGLVDREDFQAGLTSASRQYGYSAQRFLVSAADVQHAYGYGFDSSGLPTRVDQDGAGTAIVQSGNLVTAGSLAMQFDDLGRMVSRADLTLTYGPDGQLATAQRGSTTWTFVYDEKGERRLKLAGAGAPAAAYLEEGYLDASGLLEPVAIGRQVVGLVRNGSYETVAMDLRGTVLAERDGTPRLASPFGQRDVRPSVAAALDFVETGFDADLALVRMGVRDYDPSVARFSTPDPLVLENPSTCLEQRTDCNLYAYARNDPLQYTDRTGKCSQPVGLSKGQVGFCSDAFISTPEVPDTPFFAKGFGDNRSFAPNDPKATYRVQVQAIYDLTEKKWTSFSVQAGISDTKVFGSMRSKLGRAPYTVELGNDGTLKFEYQGFNGFHGRWPAPRGVILLDAKLKLFPDGEATWGPDDIHHSAYPSVGFYSYTFDANGNLVVKTLREFKETTIDQLSKKGITEPPRTIEVAPPPEP
jgi:RHS repeat-associated protein